MSFCDHCDGQRFDRARILRVLRESRKRLQRSKDAGAQHVVQMLIEEIRRLDIPHLEVDDEVADGEIIH
jgi:hypothetical protein